MTEPRTVTRPTPEQESILEAARSPGNIMISALAGTGKTRTLEMIDEATGSPNLLICFNKSIAEKAERRFRPTTTVRTLNSLGHRIWAQACDRKLTLNSKKTNEIFKLIADESTKSDRKDLWSAYDAITTGVNLAKAIGYIPSGHAKAEKSLANWLEVANLLDEKWTETIRAGVDTILTLSISWGYDGIIDFSDQLYLPALFGGTYPRFPRVLVDEWQDLSPINLAMVSKLTKSSILIGVGDDAQAIYGFRGAHEGAMADAISQFSMARLPLNTSFRCPSAIVENVLWRVPEFRASRIGGRIEYNNHADIADDSAVICRNNAPLLAVAMRLLAKGRKIDIGGVDIGGRLVRLLTNLGDESMTQSQALGAVQTWMDHKLEAGSKSAADMAECMKVFILKATTLGQAIAYARHLLAQTGTVWFMTGHKAKSLEFERVYHLDQHLIRDTGQDPNIRYVVDTRSRKSLTYIDSRTIQ